MFYFNEPSHFNYYGGQAFQKDTRMIDARRDDGCVPIITTLNNEPTYA